MQWLATGCNWWNDHGRWRCKREIHIGNAEMPGLQTICQLHATYPRCSLITMVGKPVVLLWQRMISSLLYLIRISREPSMISLPAQSYPMIFIDFHWYALMIVDARPPNSSTSPSCFQKLEYTASAAEPMTPTLPQSSEAKVCKMMQAL